MGHSTYPYAPKSHQNTVTALWLNFEPQTRELKVLRKISLKDRSQWPFFKIRVCKSVSQKVGQFVLCLQKNFFVTQYSLLFLLISRSNKSSKECLYLKRHLKDFFAKGLLVQVSKKSLCINCYHLIMWKMTLPIKCR